MAVGLGGRGRRRPVAEGTGPDVPGQVWTDLVLELPDEDLLEDLDDMLEDYVPGSKPRCEEVEYLGLIQDARHRMLRDR